MVVGGKKAVATKSVVVAFEVGGDFEESRKEMKLERRELGRKWGNGGKQRKREKSGKMAKVGKKCKTDTTTTTVFELCLDHRGPDICQNDHETKASWLILELDQRSDWVGNSFG